MIRKQVQHSHPTESDHPKQVRTRLGSQIVFRNIRRYKPIPLELVQQKGKPVRFSPIKFYYEYSESRAKKVIQKSINTTTLLPATERPQSKKDEHPDLKGRYIRRAFLNRSCDCSECGKHSTFQQEVWKRYPLPYTKQQKKKLIYWRVRKIINAVIFLLRYKRIHDHRIRMRHKRLFKLLKQTGGQPSTQSLFYLSQKLLLPQQSGQLLSNQHRDSDKFVSTPQPSSEVQDSINSDEGNTPIDYKLAYSQLLERAMVKKVSVKEPPQKIIFPNKTLHHFINKHPDINLPQIQSKPGHHRLKSLYQTNEEILRKATSVQKLRKVQSVVTSPQKVNQSKKMESSQSFYSRTNFKIQLRNLQKRL